MSVSVRVIVPLPGVPPHCNVHTPTRRVPGATAHDRPPYGTHVPCELVGTDRGANPTAIRSMVNNNTNEFAAGEIDAVVYAVRSTLS
jgi:hypothetical protein